MVFSNPDWFNSDVKHDISAVYSDPGDHLRGVFLLTECCVTYVQSSVNAPLLLRASAAALCLKKIPAGTELRAASPISHFCSGITRGTRHKMTLFYLSRDMMFYCKEIMETDIWF